MEIVFENNKIRKQCLKATGKLKKRLDDLRAAPSLEDVMPPFPGHCHALKANRKGQWAVDLEHGKRLVFEPITNEMSVSEAGWLDLEKITAIRIIEVANYHEK